MIHFSNVSKVYDETVLDDISFNINAKEIFGILGESGAGKSTILKLINQLDTQTSGSILIDNIDPTTLNNEDKRRFRQNISTIFQEYNLLQNISVRDNVMLPLKLRKAINTNAVDQALEYVGMSHKKHAYPSTLSGGEQQRVAIARAIVTNPRILLCDEATSALDARNTRYFLQVLQRINKELNTTIIVVTHELEVAKTVCDRVAILENGKLKEIVTVNKETTTDYASYTEMVKKVLEK